MTPTDTPDPADELALPAFEDALWSALRAEHAHAVPATPAVPPRTGDQIGREAAGSDHRFGDGAAGELDGGPAVIVPVRGPRRRPHLRRALAAAAAVAVVGAAGVLAVRAGDDGGPAEVRPPATEPPTTATPTTLTVEGEAAVALDELARTRVVAVEERTGGVLVRGSWSDDTSGARHAVEYRPDGERPLLSLGLAAPPDPDGGTLVDPVLRAVDHCADEHSEAPGPTLSGDLRTLADSLREGRAVIDGSEVVDGRELLVLRVVSFVDIDPETGETFPPDPSATGVPPGPATYLDPETYEPVLARDGADPETVKTYRLLPRDAAGLDLLVAEVPAGSTRVDAIRTDEERALVDCF